jgi:hypothetical protein
MAFFSRKDAKFAKKTQEEDAQNVGIFDRPCHQLRGIL